MRAETYSYRYAREILQHPSFGEAWQEIIEVVENIPLFRYPNKSANNAQLDVVQQLLNTHVDRRFAVDLHWDYHPLATGIVDSELAADFRKTFTGQSSIRIQAELQFGNMARWYSDIFKFQAAYSQNLIDLGLSVVPFQSLARRIDSNVVSFERARRELPAAVLSITLPILLIGIEPNEGTLTVDVSQSQFQALAAITRNTENRWRIVNGLLGGTPIQQIGPGSDIGPQAAPIVAGAPEE
jgi:hypothetical protein